MKQCSKCLETKELTEFYFNKSTNKKGEIKISYHNLCKDCTKEKNKKWAKENYDKVLLANRKFNKTPKGKQRLKDGSKKWRESGKQKEYQQANKDKLKKYQKNHEDHKITSEEWEACLDYFDWACAYCGFTYDQHIEEHGQQLHKEHVIHNGSNFIENCVPSCKNCNSQKHDKEFNDFYNEDNPNYSKRRLNKIIKWTTKDAFDI